MSARIERRKPREICESHTAVVKGSQFPKDPTYACRIFYNPWRGTQPRIRGAEGKIALTSTLPVARKRDLQRANGGLNKTRRGCSLGDIGDIGKLQ